MATRRGVRHLATRDLVAAGKLREVRLVEIELLDITQIDEDVEVAAHERVVTCTMERLIDVGQTKPPVSNYDNKV